MRSARRAAHRSVAAASGAGAGAGAGAGLTFTFAGSVLQALQPAVALLAAPDAERCTAAFVERAAHSVRSNARIAAERLAAHVGRRGDLF
ncbi:hypothetical protein FOA52_008544 [Chlamydomonas sp. UWO 241]|nr:hypothetical protein FOA52_008544 [Chlamydomonas sp. UWO 241]